MLNIHFINVGYGDAILIETPSGEHILVDSGDKENSEKLVEYLNSRHIKKIEAAIVTHPHKNHFGGFFSVVEKLPIKKFYTNDDNQHAEEGYANLLAIAQKAGLPVDALKEGDELSLTAEGIRLRVLHPRELNNSTNENAIALWLVYKETSILLTSDIQIPQQEELISRYPEVKAANCVQIPHHGGKISERFAGFFNRETVFIMSTGANIYDKPFEKELDKLKGKIFRTDQQGTIIVQSDGRQIKVGHD